MPKKRKCQKEVLMLNCIFFFNCMAPLTQEHLKLNNFVVGKEAIACVLDIELYLTALGEGRQFIETCDT
jgi:hypothetical protein